MDTIKKVKRQLTKLDKISTNHLSDNGPVSRICKELLQLKPNNPKFLNGWSFWTDFSQDIQMANKSDKMFDTISPWTWSHSVVSDSLWPHGHTSFLSSTKHSFVWIYHSKFIHSPIQGQFGCLQVSVIMTKATGPRAGFCMDVSSPLIWVDTKEHECWSIW